MTTLFHRTLYSRDTGIPTETATSHIDRWDLQHDGSGNANCTNALAGNANAKAMWYTAPVWCNGTSSWHPNSACDYGTANLHEDWFLHDNSGGRIGAFNQIYWMNVGNAGYQARCIAKLTADWQNTGPLGALGTSYSGIWMDGVLTSLGYAPGSANGTWNNCQEYPMSTGDHYANAGPWQTAVRSWLSNVCSSLRSIGATSLIGNIDLGYKWLDTDGASLVWKQYLASGGLTGGMEEAFACDGASDVNCAPSMAAKILTGAWCQASGYEFWTHTYATQVGRSETTAALKIQAEFVYALAAGLLAANPADRTANKVMLGLWKGVTDLNPPWYQDYANAEALGAPATVPTVGNPAAAYTKNTDGTYSRSFANGSVLVNPTGGTLRGLGAYSGLITISVAPSSFTRTATDTSVTTDAAHATAVIHGAHRATDITAVSDVAIKTSFVPPPPVRTTLNMFVRERPPLRLRVGVATPTGLETSWSETQVDPVKTHQALSFSSTMPGGFEHASMTLTRDPRRNFPDIQELATITVRGVGGSVAWQGRIETSPSSSGDQLMIQPGAVGWQSALTDRNDAREMYVECDMTKWQGADLSRKIFLQQNNFDISDASAATDGSGNPAMVTSITGTWSRPNVSEAWYDTRGLPIEALHYVWKLGLDASGRPNIGDDPFPPGIGFVIQAFLAFDSEAIYFNGTGNLQGPASGSGWLYNSVDISRPRYYAGVQLYHNGPFFPAGTSGVQYASYWPQLVLFGANNLPKYTSLDGTPGLLGSDILKHAIGKYAPFLKTTKNGQSTISQSSFVIPEMVFSDPTTVAEIIKAVTAFEFQDWAVWEGPTFWWYPSRTKGKKWRVRVGPAKLQSAGPQVDRLWNGVVVSFTDPTGLNWTAGPPGSGASIEDPALVDNDPENPVNELGLKRYAPLQMGTLAVSAGPPATAAVAIQVGKIFLAEQRVRDSAGSADLVGIVEDEHGIYWPSWLVRAGDEISFVDAADSSYRRIVSTNYNDDTRTNSVQLDVPPDTLQAILSRLQTVLAPITGG